MYLNQERWPAVRPDCIHLVYLLHRVCQHSTEDWNWEGDDFDMHVDLKMSPLMQTRQCFPYTIPWPRSYPQPSYKDIGIKGPHKTTPQKSHNSSITEFKDSKMAEMLEHINLSPTCKNSLRFQVGNKRAHG